MDYNWIFDYADDTEGMNILIATAGNVQVLDTIIAKCKQELEDRATTDL